MRQSVEFFFQLYEFAMNEINNLYINYHKLRTPGDL